MKCSLEKVSALCNGEMRIPPGADTPVITGVSIDTRTLVPGDLFVALSGEQADGHRFVDSAIAKGASAALVKKTWADARTGSAQPLLCVNDPLTALQVWAGRQRQLQGYTLVAVTGSAGKTSTKEMIYAVLSSHFNAQKTEGNLNNHIGLPLTLIRFENSVEAAVVEMGANHAGEIGFLSEMARPDVGVITNIGTAHIGLFGSRQNIAEAKFELAQWVPPSGVMILNGDDDFLPAKAAMLRREGKKVKLYAVENSEADLRAENVSLDADACARFTVSGIPFRLQVPGIHSVGNAMAAVTVGVYLKIPLETIAESLTGVSTLAGRWTKRMTGGITLIDDTYNANPASVCASLAALAQTQGARRRVAVLGDMLELGASAGELHAKVGAEAASKGIDLLVGFGQYSADLLNGARAASGHACSLHGFSERAELTSFLAETLQTGDLVLFKGSHALNLDKIMNDVDAKLRRA